MNLERKKIAFCLAGVATVLAPLVPAILNIEQRPYLLGALIANKMDCSDSTKALDPNHPYDAIVVPGAGTIRAVTGEVMPNFDQKVRLEAAAHTFLKGFAPRIVLLDGAGELNDKGVTGRVYLQAEFGKLTGGLKTIPDADILTEGNSINTATNMEELAKIATAHNLRRVVIVTNYYHQLRSTLLACINGVRASSLSAEELLDIVKEVHTPWERTKTEIKE